MSIRQGNKVLSAGQSLTQNLFDFKWADHILDDIQWLRADTFTWHDGRVYEAAYQHLLAEWNEVGDVPSTEIIAGTQIYYRLAPDGHKICSASQEDEAVAIYEATGIAWYYILDTTNQRFKLPRTKFGFVGLRDNNVGNYIPESLPNITGAFDVLLNGTVQDGNKCSSLTAIDATGAFYRNKTSNTDWHFAPEEITTNQNGHYTPSFDASRSSSVYQNNAPVQERSTQMYLYFFVGNFAQSAVVNTAGINAALVDEIQNECIDLQNNKQDIATALNYNYISNCITEIPQDIKLELNNGTLTLKAGSKVYVPNGAGVFDTITVASDLTCTAANSATYLLFYADNSITMRMVEWCFSGTEPSTSQTYIAWYDTTNNLMKYRTNSTTWYSGASLPLAIITVSNGAISSIDQVFNGFGYIGSTVFALPGVKGLIPNGRNADGSLKNTTTDNFTTVKTVQVNTSTVKIAMYPAGGLGLQTKNFGLNEAENYNYDSGILTNALEVARVIVDSNAKITAFIPKQVFHAVDYNDLNYMMPDYARQIVGTYTSGQWIQVKNDSYVVCWGGDPYTENYSVSVSPVATIGSDFIVGYRTDDTNAQTQITSFGFYVPAGWYWRNGNESGGSYRIYPVRGV